MLNLFSLKTRYIGAGMVAFVTLIALSVIFAGKTISDWSRSASVENVDRKQELSASGLLRDRENFDKENDAFKQKGNSMMTRADALIARSRLVPNEKNKASATATTAQRISDLKTRLGQPGK